MNQMNMDYMICQETLLNGHAVHIHPSAYIFQHDLQPNYEYNATPQDPPVMKRKVIRGGSWKDIAYFLQTSARDYEYQDSTKSYVGFRNVRSYIGVN